ncbi:UDP-N-acetylmuramoyl-tripeptide--D-alanyl-D-alanine ligase [Exiguobacterium mexicanum]|uniref:UDP-N-acetylmuramoyl-tripeptide--D-alanyl-D-alanine ligase n=1 Tax=Exiguobacterium mexicanum TaxID=340146 RepID=A0ABT7MLN1_9BACL|nr:MULTISPECIES: UDP-N-acetylmuramoyl-tripeptide--D-alanyl-D-alanine ligase [Exiguobacterium]MDL5375786.1 UDP-N-acetylmuramoyl-tripeptide--D-alanyl-D-alanine ligase [Exiguobacterium mexicanum]
MEQLTIQTLASWFGMEIHDSREVHHVATDSRDDNADGLFVPIIGARVDGHDYIEAAIKQGAIVTFWEQDRPLPEGIIAIPVSSPLTALQEAAARYLAEINPKVVAITGSNGKTSTKDMIAVVLGETFKTHKTAGNFNSDVGLPLTVLRMPRDTEVAVLEMGMNGFGQIELLSKLAKPDIAFVTNIGESHGEQVGGREGIAKAKLEIKAGLKPDGVLIVDADEPLLNEAGGYRVGYDSTADGKLEVVEATFDASIFRYNNELYELKVLGAHQIRNAAYAIACGLKFGLGHDTIQRGLDRVQLTSMRMEKRMFGDAHLVNDAYNASPTSMIAAVETIKTLEGFSRRVLVLGDMYELGTDEIAQHEQVGHCITAPVTDCILIGEKAKWIAAGITDPRVNVTMVPTVEEAKVLLGSYQRPQTVILLKASRGLALERLVQ